MMALRRLESWIERLRGWFVDKKLNLNCNGHHCANFNDVFV